MPFQPPAVLRCRHGVEPLGSIYTAESKNEVTTYVTEGVGEDFWPETVDSKIVDSFEMVTDAEALTMTRRLAHQKSVLAGGSSGMAAVGAMRLAEERPDDVVVVLCSTRVGTTYRGSSTTTGCGSRDCSTSHPAVSGP